MIDLVFSLDRLRFFLDTATAESVGVGLMHTRTELLHHVSNVLAEPLKNHQQPFFNPFHTNSYHSNAINRNKPAFQPWKACGKLQLVETT